jgi:hypothetical protein
VESPLDGNRFLPLRSFSKLITPDSINEELRRNLEPKLLERIVKYAKGVFIILVLVGKADDIEKLFEDGLTDERLPLYPMGESNGALESHSTKKSFESFASWDKSEIDYFLVKQWLVQSPVLDTSGEHLDLDINCALPFTHVDFDLIHGAFGKVHRGELHPDHQRGIIKSQVSII